MPCFSLLTIQIPSGNDAGMLLCRNARRLPQRSFHPLYLRIIPYYWA
ncbi:MAG: hypothetical protein AVDCRST_MAG56-4144 [uncultured Cytophagales bacterium]|uniref:Uncharacterized protein n=1 Tax=uncultured Cytophagales bacterium TaxID=158755 RepID=A0A6J4JS33_9SPHI|nr:MAG: hypothetical protein AVDCRST_MAG56-4144 [uncultured Cytophagales bacterium]